MKRRRQSSEAADAALRAPATERGEKVSLLLFLFFFWYFVFFNLGEESETTLNFPSSGTC